MGNWSIRKIGTVVAIVLTVIMVALIVVLYLLVDDDQSALEKLRDIAIIFNQVLFLITVILLAAITAALIWLAIKVKDQVIPMLEEGLGILREFKGTATRVSNTTNFITEEAIRPFVAMNGQIAKIRKMGQIVTGRSKDLPDPPTFTSHSGRRD